MSVQPPAVAKGVSTKLVVLATSILFLLALALGISLWFAFHRAPTQAEIRSLLASADELEVFELDGKKFRRFVWLTDKGDWQAAVDLIRFGDAYWSFSDVPRQSVVIQCFVRTGQSAVTREQSQPRTQAAVRRTIAWDVRGDGCFHIHKAGRWYKMPVDPAFENWARALVEARGEDLVELEHDPDRVRALLLNQSGAREKPAP